MAIKPATAAYLRERMVERFGSVRQFALQTGIERTRVYPILRGEGLPSLRGFVAIAHGLGLSLSELATYLDVPTTAGRKENE